MDLLENTTGEIVSNRHPWEIARYSIIQEKVKIMYDQFNGINVVLIDIGCGDSYVVSKLSTQYNFKKIYGIDINFNDEIIQNLSTQYKNINFVNSLNNVEINNNFNYIFLLNDVIEHIENDIDFLQNLKDKIFNNLNKSFLFITVPAFNFLFSKHDIDLGHFRRYKISNLFKYNNILKMSVFESGYFFILPLFARFLSKIISLIFNQKPNKIGVSDWNHSKGITKLTVSLLKLDYFISKKLFYQFPGLSTFIIFKK